MTPPKFRAKNQSLQAHAVRILDDERPMTLRALYYRLASAGHLPATEAGYSTVCRVPAPIRTHGTCPSLVSCHRCRGEMPRAFAASRGRKAKVFGTVFVIVVHPTVPVPRRAVRIPVGEMFGSEIANGRWCAQNRLESQGFAAKRKFPKCSATDVERSNTAYRIFASYPPQLVRSRTRGGGRIRHSTVSTPSLTSRCRCIEICTSCDLQIVS